MANTKASKWQASGSQQNIHGVYTVHVYAMIRNVKHACSQHQMKWDQWHFDAYSHHAANEFRMFMKTACYCRKYALQMLAIHGKYTAQTQEPRVRLVESDTLKKEWKKSAKHRNPNDDARTRILLVIWTNLVVEMRVLQSQNANVAVVVVVVAFFVNSHYSFVSMQMIITQLNR